jgi:crotonobetainyl-CoA:carnitine CoA-transferase CaiB-like acyl-CoA transferase
VIEVGDAVAALFAGALLADFDTDVVQIERLGVGDSLRAMGPEAIPLTI